MSDTKIPLHKAAWLVVGLAVAGWGVIGLVVWGVVVLARLLNG